MYATLISAASLREHLSDNNLLIVDCRFDLSDTRAGRRSYETAHIPGAVYAHLDDDLSGTIIPGTTGRHPLPSVSQLTALFSLWGINEEVQVVVYDDKGGGIAARLWWMLRYLGHEAVAVLDGGWPAWLAAAYPVSDRPASLRPAIFKPNPRESWRVDAATVDKLRTDSDYFVVDSRTAARYRGEMEPIDPVAGHIPGAINLPFPENLQDGNFLEAAQLKKRFESALDGKPPERVVFYCGSGVTACHNLLAFAHAGLGNAVLYPGSWSEWITEKHRPIGTGKDDQLPA